MPQIHLKNFRCLRDVHIELTPVTALCGSNAAGKSSVLSALNPKMGVRAPDLWRAANSGPIERRISLPGGSIYEVRNSPSNGFAPHVSGNQADYDYQAMRLDLRALRANMQIARATALTWDGGNIVNLMASLPLAKRVEVSDALAALIPVFGGVETLPMENVAGQHRLAFRDRWDPSHVFTADEVSDGTLLILAFLLLRYQTVRPLVLTVEEPERGLHPYLMARVVQLLRDFAAPDGTLATQVVLATQSSDFVECLRPEEVRFLRRSETDGSTIVEQPDTTDPDWTKIFQNYDESLGGMWLAGGLGGVPGSR